MVAELLPYGLYYEHNTNTWAMSIAGANRHFAGVADTEGESRRRDGQPKLLGERQPSSSSGC